ncbi:MAG: hypothetical protein IPK44_00995 [Candidatus Accumulibacter sp.]|uniref:LamG-like jellyroll fold domain-containing protein n=1 Tax=Accumulibacter sp. TaxID=2053492 RepID=UPI002586BAA6|nr:LamG-like jellyroll fold domain-containing protein [Accumulibacter sp.]MBK8113174.1 hypothetical protein [Accumulibacter sp.]
MRDRSTGLYLGGANSDPSTGLYTFYPPDFGEVIVERIDELADPVTDEAVFDLDPSVGAVGGTLPADTRGNALTFLGDAKISTDALSFVFDGSGDVIQSASSRYTLGTDDFCIDIEFYPINGGRGSNYARLFQLGANTTAGTLVIFTGTTTPTIIEAKFWDGATYQSLANSSPTTYADNAWHKLQLRRVAGVFFMTIDDVLVSTSATTAYNIAAATLSIGANAANAENFYGRIGKVRISRGARRAAAATPTSRLLKMPADSGSGENALIYDRVIPGG